MALNARPGHHSTAPLAEINTTPLVDVMLVLFVIFLVTAPMLTHTVPLSLPKEQVSAQQPPPERQTLSVDATGRYYWNDEPNPARSRGAAKSSRAARTLGPLAAHRGRLTGRRWQCA